MKNRLRKNAMFFWLSVILVAASFLLKWRISTVQRMWLDGQYSVFFAVTTNPQDLLFTFSQDIHPGGYYLILKAALEMTQDLTFLRLITAILPATLGLGALVAFHKKIHHSLAISTVIIFLLSFNPFFNSLSAQLRMYGWVFLWTILDFLALRQWQSKKTPHSITLLISCLFVGNFFSYSLFFVAAAVGAFVIHTGYSAKKGRLFLIALSILTAQFFFLSGTHPREQFAKASWIAQPVFDNLGSVYFTGLGLNEDIHNLLPHPGLTLILLIAAGILIRIHPRRTPELQEMAALVGLPMLAILVLSLLFPFLSHRYFFFQFIPDVSLFLARSQTPFFIFFFLLLAPFLSKIRLRLLVTGCAFLAVVWTFFTISISFQSQLDFYGSDLQTQLENEQRETALVWPAWIWYTSVSLHHLTDIPTLPARIARSEQLEQLLWNDQYPTQKIVQQFCSNIGNSTYFISKKTTHFSDVAQRNIRASLAACCRLETKNTDFEKWRCQEITRPSFEPSALP